MECQKSDTISNLWDANKSSVELFRNDLFNLKCCTVAFDKNRHNSIEAPLEMPLRKVKDNVTASFSVENQGKLTVSQATESSKSAFEILRKTVCLSKKPTTTKKDELYNWSPNNEKRFKMSTRTNWKCL